MSIRFSYPDNIYLSYWFIYDVDSKTYELSSSGISPYSHRYTEEDAEMFKTHVWELYGDDILKAVSFYDKAHNFLLNDSFELETYDFFTMPRNPSTGVKYVLYTKDVLTGFYFQFSYRPEHELNHFVIYDSDKRDDTDINFSFSYNDRDNFILFDKVKAIGATVIDKSPQRLKMLF